MVYKRKLFRVVPGLLIWLLLITLVVSCIWFPRVFCTIATAFYVYNLYLMTFIAYYSNKGVSKFIEHDKYEIAVGEDSPLLYVIIPNYKETISGLAEMLLNLAKSPLAKTKIIPVMAMEEREQEAAKKAQTLHAAHSPIFKDFLISIHPMNLPNEVPGKSSNEAYAFRIIEQHVAENALNPDNIIVTTCDADSHFHPKYFEFVSQKFKNSVDPHNRIWQSAVCNYMNYNTIPLATLLMSTAVTMHEIACLADESDVHIPFSTYSMSFNLAKHVGGWDGDVIAEDWHMLIKCLFGSEGKVRVEPIPLPMMCSTVELDSTWSSIQARFLQSKRHAWGVAEISYFWDQLASMFLYSKNFLDARIIRYLVKMTNIHIFASVNIIVIILGGAQRFAYQNIESFASAPDASDILDIWQATFVYQNYLVPIAAGFTLYSNYRLVKFLQGEVPLLRLASWIFAFAAFTVVANVYLAAYPEIWAFTMLMFQDNIEYVVAPKGATPATPASPAEQYAPVAQAEPNQSA